MKNTKENRLKLLEYQFNSLIEKGFKKSVYKDLTIFVNLNDRPTLKIFCGTSTKPILFYWYRSVERLNEALEKTKEIADIREKRKLDAAGNKKLSGHAAAAKAIRNELKNTYPEIKFSVTSESFSMGNSVHISWYDGPTTNEVDSIVKKYQYGHFDGMTDMYEYSNDRDDIPQTKYVQTSRTMSDETKEILTPFIEEIFKLNKFDCYDSSNLLYRLFYKSSFPANAELKGIEPTGETCGLNSIDVFYKITFKNEVEYINFKKELLTI